MGPDVALKQLDLIVRLMCLSRSLVCVERIVYHPRLKWDSFR